MKQNNSQVALISGVTGQDGSYLTELLLDKEYEVHGIKRRSSSLNTERIDHVYEDPHVNDQRFHLHYGDLTDGLNLSKLIAQIKPTEVYNLGAQSHVAVSFDLPEYSTNVDAVGTLRLLEAIKFNGFEKNNKILSGFNFRVIRQSPGSPSNRKKTPFTPRSPYAVAKLYAYWIVVNYREAYGLHASNGILFNHESPRRGETFVTRKITIAVASIKLGKLDKLFLGNLDAKRDWGHAQDYVEMMWLILQNEKPDDYVAATNRTVTVREFVNLAFSRVGIDISWEGEGINEKGICSETGKILVEVDPKYFRPTEVDLLIGDPSKAKKELGWAPKITLEELVNEMVDHDLDRLINK